MKAGRLRHRVRIEQQVQSVDKFGAPAKTWLEVVETNASINTVSPRAGAASGKESYGAESDYGEQTWKIILRRWPGFHLDGMYRAVDVDTGAVYDIRSVAPSHARDILTLKAVSGSSHS